jgi:exopolysaccharide biosynthesis polyprenyl glycosylphosphotransferase
MRSSLEFRKSSQEYATQLPLGLHLARPAEGRNTAAHVRQAIGVCEVVIDLVTIAAAIVASHAVYVYAQLGKQIYYPPRVVLGAATVFAIIMVLMLDRVGAYSGGNSLLRVRETEQVLRVSGQALLIAFAFSFLTSTLFSRWLLTICFTLVPLFLFAQKHLVYLLLRAMHSKGYGMERVLIYGSGFTGRRVFSVLSRSPKLGLDPIAFVDDDLTKTGTTIYAMGYERRHSAQVIAGGITRELVASRQADLVIIAIPSVGYEKFIRAADEALAAKARVAFVPNVVLPSFPWLDYQDVDGVLLASFSNSIRRWGHDFVKRMFDVLGAMFLLIVGSPLFLLLALLVKLDSPGPAFFRQRRMGQHGRPFMMFKFRTMHPDSPSYAYSPDTSSDPRITSLGRFLRRSSLDELPQLLNVLAGTMSLVGPRPEMPFIVETYNEVQRQRLQVKPGLTGLWQLSGDRGFQIHENVEYDLYYIQNRNFFMDLAILLHTPIFAMRGI